MAWNPAALLQPTSNSSSNGSRTSSGMQTPPVSRDRSDSDLNGSVVFQFASTNDSASDAIPSGASTPSSIHMTSANGVGSFVERMNNVQHRDSIPQAKRRKVDDEMEEVGANTTQQAVRTGSSMLGGYIKEQQRQGTSTPTSDTMMVDLTNGISNQLTRTIYD